MAEPALSVAIIMGSQADWETMRVAGDTLTSLHIGHETRILSAPRASGALVEYLKGAEARGVRIFIAGAGGAAHLAGVVAAHTILPVLGVPVPLPALQGLDSLFSFVQMPKGLPVGTLAIGGAGAMNAGLFAAAILALTDAKLSSRLLAYREEQTRAVLAQQLPLTTDSG